MTCYHKVHNASMQSEMKLSQEAILVKLINMRLHATKLHTSDLGVLTTPHETWRLCAIDLVWGMLCLANPCAKPSMLLYVWWQNLETASDLMGILCNADWATTQGRVFEDELQQLI